MPDDTKAEPKAEPKAESAKVGGSAFEKAFEDTINQLRTEVGSLFNAATESDAERLRTAAKVVSESYMLYSMGQRTKAELDNDVKIAWGTIESIGLKYEIKARYAMHRFVSTLFNRVINLAFDALIPTA